MDCDGLDVVSCSPTVIFIYVFWPLPSISGLMTGSAELMHEQYLRSAFSIFGSKAPSGQPI